MLFSFLSRTFFGGSLCGLSDEPRAHDFFSASFFRQALRFLFSSALRFLLRSDIRFNFRAHAGFLGSFRSSLGLQACFFLSAATKFFLYASTHLRFRLQTSFFRGTNSCFHFSPQTRLLGGLSFGAQTRLLCCLGFRSFACGFSFRSLARQFFRSLTQRFRFQAESCFFFGPLRCFLFGSLACFQLRSYALFFLGLVSRRFFSHSPVRFLFSTQAGLDFHPQLRFTFCF